MSLPTVILNIRAAHKLNSLQDLLGFEVSYIRHI